MRRQSLTPALILLTMTGCHEAEIAPAPDAGAPIQEHPAGAQFPTNPDSFRIKLSGSACFGSCPTYEVSIDQDGNVSFLGETCVARPGAFVQQVSATDARAIYDALMATEFASLGDRYVEEADGCEVWTDAPTFTWNVRADGTEKPLERYAGCEGVEALEAVDAVMPLFHERAGVLRYLEPNPFNCDYQQAQVFAVDLRLSYRGAALGVLKIVDKNGWSGSFELSDCAGTVQARGDLQIENRRWLLLDEKRMPFALSEPLGKAGSMIVDLEAAPSFGAPASIRGVRALRQDDDLSFDFALGSTCAP